mgnify:CR=1 FL=1
MNIERSGVSSSNVASVGYNKDEEVLEVEFNSGAVYQYYGVSEEVYLNMLSANSVGKYFNDSVKDIYPFSRV